MTISWTGFARGSIKDAVKMTIIGLLMGSMLLPVYIRIFLGASVSISILSILRQALLLCFGLVNFIFISMALKSKVL